MSRYLVSDHGYPGVVQVQPRGDLPVGHHEDVSHPGGVSLHRAQRIAELLVVLEPACRHVLIPFGLEPEWEREESCSSKFPYGGNLDNTNLAFCNTAYVIVSLYSSPICVHTILTQSDQWDQKYPLILPRWKYCFLLKVGYENTPIQYSTRTPK